jgi:hypothetical protein
MHLIWWVCLASWAGLAAKPTAQRSIKEETIFVRLLTLKERERETERQRERERERERERSSIFTFS